MRIIGLDLSLTATGVAIIDGANALTLTITSAARREAALSDRANRLAEIVAEVLSATLHPETPDLVVVEQPAFSRTTGHHHDRSGLWWMVVRGLLDWPLDVAEVTPGGLKKFVTGRGNAGKDEVLLAVARRFPDVEVRNNNEADALVLAAMGADHMGLPLVDMPAAHRAALDAVRWPQAVVA